MLDILARDGDTGIPRELKLTILGDDLGYFQLEQPVRGEARGQRPGVRGQSG